MAEKTASLTVLGGPFAGTRCALPETGVLTIGSAEGVTLRLDLPSVSPFHARVEVEAGRVVVHEAGADRPLHVNDNPLDPGGTVLRNGDILWLGSPGEDDVVMLQCVLPRRAVGAPPVAPPGPSLELGEAELQPTLSGPAVPTPEVETQAMWSFGDDALVTPPLAAAPAREEPATAEEATATSDGLAEVEEPAADVLEPVAETLAPPPEVLRPPGEPALFPDASRETAEQPADSPDEAAEPAEVAEPAPELAEEVVHEATAPEDALVFSEPTLAGTSEDEVSAAVDSGEEVVFVEATEAELVAPEAEPSPTILVASVEELASPSAPIDFGEDVVAAPEPVLAPPLVEGEVVFAREPVEEQAPPAPAPRPLRPVPVPLPPAAAPVAPPPVIAPRVATPPPVVTARVVTPPPVVPPPAAMPPAATPPAAIPPAATPPAAARPAVSAPRQPAARPEAPPRPPAERPATRPPRPAAQAPARTRPAPDRAARPAAAPPEAGEPEAVEDAPAGAGGPRTLLLALAGAGGALLLLGAAWVGWRLLAQPSAVPPAAPPAPLARATVEPPPLPTPTVMPVAVEPTPETMATPAATPLPTPTPLATATPPGPARATPTPAPTPTPRGTPTPAAARATPTPPPGPSAEALAAQQRAAEAQSLLAQAEAAVGAKQFDAAVSHLDGVLRLDPANARATTLRAEAVRRRDIARRRFAAGRTAVQGQKAQKSGSLAGFDTGDADLRSSDFLGRVEFEMTPASGIEPGDAWTLQVYVVNEGKKAIRVSGLVLGTTVNGAAGGGPLPPRAREVAPQQRTLVGETKGTWAEGTTSWVAEATVTGGKGETLKNTLTWR